jgi:hypothetical protein
MMVGNFFDHEEKSAIIWQSFKSRVGCSDNPTMQFGLDMFISVIDSMNFSSLETPFTHEEIDEVIKLMPSDKAPDHDGFNEAFLKNCWNLVKEQFYILCDDFFNEILELSSINNAFITLIPKSQNPETTSDYRPISLVRLALKFITKLLANRLQRIIIPVVHKNMYGFIKKRTIQDCLASSFEYLHLCHKSKNETVFVKIDSEKD